jgi:Na+-driven multidrug efflux pump
MWVTIISDGVSIATQSLISRYFAQNTEHGNKMSHFVIRRSFQIGLILSSVLALLLYSCRGPIISVLTKHPDIQAAASNAFPVFLLAQGERHWLHKW